MLGLSGGVSKSDDLATCLLALNVKELDVLALSEDLGVLINDPELIIAIGIKMCALALKPWSFENGPV